MLLVFQAQIELALEAGLEALLDAVARPHPDDHGELLVPVPNTAAFSPLSSYSQLAQPIVGASHEEGDPKYLFDPLQLAVAGHHEVGVLVHYDLGVQLLQRHGLTLPKCIDVNLVLREESLELLEGHLRFGVRGGLQRLQPRIQRHAWRRQRVIHRLSRGGRQVHLQLLAHRRGEPAVPAAALRLRAPHAGDGVARLGHNRRVTGKVEGFLLWGYHHLERGELAKAFSDSLGQVHHLLLLRRVGQVPRPADGPARVGQPAAARQLEGRQGADVHPHVQVEGRLLEGGPAAEQLAEADGHVLFVHLERFQRST
mmetsp:Transcript_13603/g.38715  ORF Transcript_13603/g.38715 Transcript_13603/m.38715 type:complete len:312 (+) Transcript_13603:2849-3784(+)